MKVLRIMVVKDNQSIILVPSLQAADVIQVGVPVHTLLLRKKKRIAQLIVQE